MDEFLLTDEEIIAEASKDQTYCQLSVDIGMWTTQAEARKLIKWLEEHNLLKSGGGLVLGAGDWQELEKFKDKVND